MVGDFSKNLESLFISVGGLHLLELNPSPSAAGGELKESDGDGGMSSRAALTIYSAGSV